MNVVPEFGSLILGTETVAIGMSLFGIVQVWSVKPHVKTFKLETAIPALTILENTRPRNSEQKSRLTANL